MTEAKAFDNFSSLSSHDVTDWMLSVVLNVEEEFVEAQGMEVGQRVSKIKLSESRPVWFSTAFWPISMDWEFFDVHVGGSTIESPGHTQVCF